MVSLLLALISLLVGIFILVSFNLPSQVFTIELVVLILLVLLCLVLIRSLQNAARTRFLLKVFFLCSTANAVFLYLATARSVIVLFLGAVSLAGFFLSFFWKKKKEKKKKLRRKKAEVAKQLGPEEEKPKVVVLKKKKRKAKKRK
jgi:O-antigen/teichoic acid export membrane protein